MSTISEVDIRDWEKIDLEIIKNCAQKLNNEGFNMSGGDLWEVFNQLELIRDKQIKQATKNVAALFKPKE